MGEKRSVLPWILLGCGCSTFLGFLGVVALCGLGGLFGYQTMVGHDTVRLSRGYAIQSAEIRERVGSPVEAFPFTGMKTWNVEESDDPATAHLRWGFTTEASGDSVAAQIETRLERRSGAWRIVSAHLHHQGEKLPLSVPEEGFGFEDLPAAVRAEVTEGEGSPAEPGEGPEEGGPAEEEEEEAPSGPDAEAPVEAPADDAPPKPGE